MIVALITHGLRRLLRVVGEQASGLERLSRSQLRRERRCVGCQENEGHRLEPVLGWICTYCDEVIDIVYEKEIEEVEQARAKVQEFLDAMDRVGFAVR